MFSLRERVAAIALEHPETRKALLPLLRRFASCPDCGGVVDMEDPGPDHVVVADGDDLMGGRVWDGDPSKPDDNPDYRPPSGRCDKNYQPGSRNEGHKNMQKLLCKGWSKKDKAKYNKLYQEQVCDSGEHATNCGR